MLERGDEPQPVAQLVAPALRVRSTSDGPSTLENAYSIWSSIGLGSKPRASMNSCKRLFVDVGVDGLLADEAAHVVDESWDP